jgi:hypothetical protein
MYGKEQQSRLLLLQVLLFIACCCNRPAASQPAAALNTSLPLIYSGWLRLSPARDCLCDVSLGSAVTKYIRRQKIYVATFFFLSLLHFFAIFVVYLRPWCAAESHQLLRNRRHRSLWYWGCCWASTPKKILARGLLNFESSNERGGRAEAQ